MSRAFRLGLTGSIGMGKSTTALMFSEAGIPVWDADAAVHRLYAPGGAAVAPLAAAFSGVVKGGQVDRAVLRSIVRDEPEALKRLEAIVHPLVAADRSEFVAAADRRGEAVIVLDIPLLFETGADGGMDGIVVVSAQPEVQRARVLSRPGMDEATLATILSRQMPDAEKRARATWVIDTTTMDGARQAVQQILEDIRARRAAEDA